MAAARLPLLVLFSLFLFAASCAAQEDGPRFSCSATGARSRCQALAGYHVDNETSYGAIITLFQVNSSQDLYRLNDLSATTAVSTSVPAGTLVKVPFPCACRNGVGVADPRPVYTVVAGDILYNIAAIKFKGLLIYQQIVAANMIKNESLIEPGWKIKIPLPCSCDAVDGAQAVHLAYVVAKGDSLGGIATRFGTSPATLSRINNISDPKSLEAGQVLDVPLQGIASPPASTPASWASPPASTPRSRAHAQRPLLWGLPWSWTQPLLGVVAPLYSALLLLALM